MVLVELIEQHASEMIIGKRTEVGLEFELEETSARDIDHCRFQSRSNMIINTKDH